MLSLKKIIVFVFLFAFLFINDVDARSGCCSHHGGVCGCKCCDGTSLSAKCAPYYPACNSKKAEPIVIPPVENSVTTDNTSTNTNEDSSYVSGSSSNNSNYVTSDSGTGVVAGTNTVNTNKDNNTWGYLLTIGAMGVAYYFYSKKNNKKDI